MPTEACMQPEAWVCGWVSGRMSPRLHSNGAHYPQPTDLMPNISSPLKYTWSSRCKVWKLLLHIWLRSASQVVWKLPKELPISHYVCFSPLATILWVPCLQRGTEVAGFVMMGAKAFFWAVGGWKNLLRLEMWNAGWMVLLGGTCSS